MGGFKVEFENLKLKYADKYDCIQVDPDQIEFMVDDIYDERNIISLIQDCVSAMMYKYLEEVNSENSTYYPNIIPDIFNNFGLKRLYIWNKNRAAGFGIFIECKECGREFIWGYSGNACTVMNDLLFVDPNTLQSKYSCGDDRECEWYDDYLKAAIRGICEAERKHGFKYEELDKFTGSCEIDRFYTIMRAINGHGKYELFDGNVVTYSSKCDEDVTDNLVSFSSDVIEKCQVFSSLYVSSDMSNLNNFYVDWAIYRGEHDRVYIHCYTGTQSIRESALHYSMFRWGEHVEHIMVFVDTHKLVSIHGKGSCPRIIEQNDGVFTSQLIEGVTIRLKSLDCID